MINPFVYAMRLSSFREAITRLIARNVCGKRGPVGPDNTDVTSPRDQLNVTQSSLIAAFPFEQEPSAFGWSRQDSAQGYVTVLKL